MRAPRINRAIAIVLNISSREGSGCAAIGISDLARKFCTMTSWMCRNFSCISRMASNESMRSSIVSPIPIRIPVVNAMERFPASSMVRSRKEGTLSGALACGNPLRISRALTFASIRPTLAFENVSARLMRNGLPHADVLEHQANAGIRLFELVERSAVHHARIRVRQEPGTLQHQFAHGRHVIKRTYVSLLRKEFSRFRENAFRLIPQAEESFLATRATASFRKRQHFLRRHEMRAGLSRVFSKSAIGTIVPAERGQ